VIVVADRCGVALTLRSPEFLAMTLLSQHARVRTLLSSTETRVRNAPDIHFATRHMRSLLVQRSAFVRARRSHCFINSALSGMNAFAVVHFSEAP
jgi:hypothetical protein